MWDERSCAIFSEIIREFEKEKIEYFILRNHKGLPEVNTSKDIDLVIRPEQLRQAREIVYQAYEHNHCEYRYETKFDTLYCTHGMSLTEKTGIHIDLLKGYRAKGYEPLSFDAMFAHTYFDGKLCVLEQEYRAFLTLVTKIFGYQHPKLKEEYRKEIQDAVRTEKDSFVGWLRPLLSEKMSKSIIQKIGNNEFDQILEMSGAINKKIKRRTFIKSPLKSMYGVMKYWLGKAGRILLFYRKYKKVVAVIAPDGTGKTALIDEIKKNIQLLFVNDAEDQRCHVIHFRPTILPNLGRLGESAGLMKQDVDWENPHRNKPANGLSSFFRMGYYTADYIFGWQKVVRNDVRFDRFTIFDRYGYDFLVDPERSRMKLPLTIRKMFVALMPKPNLTFVMLADPEIVHQRKQELPMEEIERQNGEYQKLLKKDRFRLIDATNSLEENGFVVTRMMFDEFLEKVK